MIVFSRQIRKAYVDYSFPAVENTVYSQLTKRALKSFLLMLNLFLFKWVHKGLLFSN
jgi:hypothetical protein